jgi:hypothetical protein
MDRYLPLIISLFICLYALLILKFQRSVQPLRLEMAEKGEWLLSSNSVDATVKARVSRMLDGAFNYRLTVLLRIAIVPFLAPLIILRPATLDNMSAELHTDDELAKTYINDVFMLHTRITIANHPILFAILIAEMSIVIPLFDLSYVIMNGLVSATIRGAWKARGFLFVAFVRPLNAILAFTDEKMYQYVRIA